MKYIKAIENKDQSLILKWKSNQNLRDMIGTVFPISEIEHENWFENLFNNNDKMFVIKDENLQSIGIIGLKNIDYLNGNAEIFLFIGEDNNKKKGYGGKAFNELLDLCFLNLRFQMVYLKVFSFNDLAVSFYERNGMKRTGIFEESKFWNNEYHNTLIFSMIKKTWQDKRNLGEIKID